MLHKSSFPNHKCKHLVKNPEMCNTRKVTEMQLKSITLPVTFGNLIALFSM